MTAQQRIPSTVVLRGASDDLIEVEGVVKGCDEYNAEDAHFVLIGPAGSTRVRVWYTRRGLWAIAAAPVDEGKPMLEVSIEHAENGYSAMARVDGVEMVIHESPMDTEG